MKKNRYVLVESNEPDTLLRFGVEVYKDKETKPIRSYWFRTDEDRIKGIKKYVAQLH